jgi:secreted PhoX family phosphatase
MNFAQAGHSPGKLSRRELLQYLFFTAGAMAMPSVLASGAHGLPGRKRFADIGPLGPPDANGIRLPAGFSSRVLAVSGEVVPGTSYVWHPAPDAGAVFTTSDRGWVYVNNSEATPGGAGALRFDARGNVVDAYRILENTRNNCAGGPTPWNTWLSCEEQQDGLVYECDPLGAPETARALPALGTFNHEAAAVDPLHRHVYLTEDSPVGRFYRFVPGVTDWPPGAARPALQAGRLEAMEIVGTSAPASATPVRWHTVIAPNVVPLTAQVPQATLFNGGEGLWYFDGFIYFSTKGDNRIWVYDTIGETVEIVYDFATAENPILAGVDNLTVSRHGDVLVAEDGGDMELCVILPDRRVLPLLQITGHDGSEVTGPVFSPDGRRIYVNSQRGRDGAGMTFEILLPFAA